MLLFVQFSIGLQAGKTGQKYDKINFNTGFCLLPLLSSPLEGIQSGNVFQCLFSKK